jgi:hypothetical protein
LLLAAMMKINCYPKTLTNAHLFGLPVDFTAKSIVYLSTVQPQDIYGKIYHVLNPTNEVLFTDIIDNMRDCGVQLESVSLEEWRIKLKTISDRNNLFECIGEFLHENSFEGRCQLSAEQFYRAISPSDLPCLDSTYLMKWLTFILENIANQ